jgi:hypothetical protein
MTIHGLGRTEGSTWFTKTVRDFREKRQETRRAVQNNINQYGKRERVSDYSQDSPQKRRSVDRREE